MNKKIISEVLGGVMAAASALAFAGCGHKHAYTHSFVLASCEREGYTLHTCTECGYKYADDFTDAYGHAYEYCLAVAVTEAAPSSDSGAGDNDIADAFSGVGLDDLIASPLHSLQISQQKTVEQYMQEFLKLPETPSKIHYFVKQDCPYCDQSGAVGYKSIEIDAPLLSLTPIPDLALELTETDFQMDIKSEGADLTNCMGDWSSHNVWSLNARDDKFSKNGDTVLAVPNEYTFTSGVTPQKNLTQVDSLIELMAQSKQPLQVVMPDAIENIGEGVFSDCTELRRGQLPENLKTVGANAFSSSKFDFIVIPKGLESVGQNAFGDCKNMKCVFYCGTEAEWNEINFASGNEAFKSVKRYYYSETKPTAAGNFWRFVCEEPTVW